MTILENEPLAPRTTFKLGGAARFLIEVSKEEELPAAFSFAKEQKLPVAIIGGGSNILADDGIAEGVFIVPKCMGINRTEDGYVVGAGVSWDDFVAHAVGESRWGVENLSGIPGTVGGAVVQNAGAYGSEIGDSLRWVDAYDTSVERVVRLTREECGLSYRMSRFKAQQGRLVIVRAAFNTVEKGLPKLSYRDLRERFQNVSAVSLIDVREAVLAIRAAKFPDLAVEGTAGSFFKNPSVPLSVAREFAVKYPEMPMFPNLDGTTVKLALAWLLDRVLRVRGVAVGPVRAYEKQPLVIVAQQGATARDVRAFARTIQLSAQNELSLNIEPEVCVMHGAQCSTAL